MLKSNSRAYRLTFTLIMFSAFVIAAPNSNCTAADQVDFDREVKPILDQYCVGCHTKDDPEGGYVMETYAELISGGNHGTAVTPGAVDSSRLLLMLQGKLQPTMPPEGETRPSETEIKVLVNWVDEGAVGPKGPPNARRDIKTPTIPRNSSIALPVTALASTQDGRFRATARYGAIEITTATGESVSNIHDNLKKINSLRFNHDGTRLLVASGMSGAYGVASLYSVETGERLQEWVGHRDILYAAEFSPDESLIATAGYDREIILWDAKSGSAVRKMSGHNGAIFDLEFSSDGQILVSACADETVKIWNVETGRRLDTLSQPEAEVFAVTLTKDDRHIIAGGADNRIRIWELKSRDRESINPLLATRYVDDSAITHLETTHQNQSVAIITQTGNLKFLDTNQWTLYFTADPLNDTATAVLSEPNVDRLTVCLMNGEIVTVNVPKVTNRTANPGNKANQVFLDLGELAVKTEEDLPTVNISPNTEHLAPLQPRGAPRGAQIEGRIAQSGESDLYQWTAKTGEQWAIDVDAAPNSLIDPIVTILDSDQRPVLRTRLQAVRESYFTFRGKDSKQVGDFRLFNWEEMRLNDYLFAAGEVTRLWLYPRGPDSGYNVYPNDGQRWTYFGTTHTTHALGEPAYVVRPLNDNEVPTANGLPTFDVYYENDDDPQRREGKNSRLIFSTPKDGKYYARITDTRGMGGDQFTYILRIRPSAPNFLPSIAKANGKIHRGTGREFTVRIDRIDEFDGEVTFEIPDLPSDFTSNLPLTIEKGQRFATGCLWLPSDANGWEGTITPNVIATATVHGKRVERNLGSVGDLTLADPPSAIPTIHPIDREVAPNESWTLQVRRGETVSARVMIQRKDGFNNEVSFGKEDAGRNSTHGVYVDNIGLNGLLVRQSENIREFFLTADPIAKVGKRFFHLRAGTDGGVTSHPIIVEVLP